MGRKRKSGEGTVRLRKDGRWEGRAVVGYDDKGLPKTRNVLAKTKGECIEKLKALKETLAPSTPTSVKSDMAFGDWMDFWYERCCKPNIRPNTQLSYERLIRLNIKPKLGDIPLCKLTSQDIQQFYNWMKSEGRIDGGGFSAKNVRNGHTVCSGALDKAVAEGLIPRNPAANCKLPPVKQQEMKILTREEMQRLLIQAKEENYYELFLLEFATGLRIGELIALQWDDIDMTTGALRINKQATMVNSELVISEPKTKASIRTLILPHSVLKVMAEYKACSDSRWLFPSPRKEDAPLLPAIVRQRLYKLLDRAGCKQVRFHDLRHLFATNALANGMDIKTLSTILGHVSAATTLNIYAHITDTMRKSAALKIDQGIAKAELPPEDEKKSEEHTMTTFQATKRWQRKAG